MPNPTSQARQRFLYMLGLILAGEAIYALPFQITRFFRPSVLELFDITATELGAAQSIYGIVAMLMYFPGGPLADRFPARKLMAVSLWTTALGGLYMATFPGYQGAMLVWGFFGITTIALFWAALIRATREWGGAQQQGRAYGILDGGRGLLAAAMASAGVMVFAVAFPDGYDVAGTADKHAALRQVIYGYTAVTVLVGVFIWFALPDDHGLQPSADASRRSHGVAEVRDHIATVLRLPAVWLQALIIICAYVAFKGFDNYGLFAVQAYGLDEVEAAGIVALGSWVRPVAALAAGLLGDRFNVSRMLLWLFVLLLLSDLLFAFTAPATGIMLFLVGNTLVACIAIFGLRGLYFAFFEEAKVPPAVTGTAVGFVSVIGYTPDIFVNLVAGLLIDANPGITGHQHFFMFLAGFAALGMLASFLLVRTIHPHNGQKKM